ncbi:MAG TPA: hypothetical protein VMI92_06810 [Steroidobacteraceae bacterium]|nr:hypothetical protein [Steroidobacteraceae bacterium]
MSDSLREAGNSLRAMPAKVGSAASNVASAAKAAGREVGAVARQEAADLRRELDELVSHVPSMSAAALAAAKEQFLLKAEATRHHARHLSDGVRQQVNHAVDATSDHVREQPLRSLAAGIGLGILIGLLIAARGRDR